MKHVSFEIMFNDLNQEAQMRLLEDLNISDLSELNLEIVPLAVYETEIEGEDDEWADDCQCPNGGDESDDCADCPYAADYHFDPKTGDCVRRD